MLCCQYETVYEQPTQRKKRGLAITLSVISGLLVIALLTCWLTNCFGFYGPTNQIIRAVEDTFIGGNFTIRLTTQNDPAASPLDLTLKIDVDFDHKKLSILALNEDDFIPFFIYDSYFVYSPALLFSQPSPGSSNGYYAFNISKYVDKFFHAADSVEDFDLEELLNSIDDELYDQLDEALYIDRLEKPTLKLYRNLNSNFWLKDHAGYTKKQEDGVAVYHFEPDLYQLSTTVLEDFEDCFRNEAMYNEAIDKLKNSRKDLCETDISLSFGINHGMLVSWQYSLTTKESTQSIAVEFTDIRTTEIDTGVLDRLLGNAYVVKSR